MSGVFDLRNKIYTFGLCSGIKIKGFTSSYPEVVGDDLVFPVSTSFSPLSRFKLVWRKEKRTNTEIISVLLKNGKLIDIGRRVISEEDDPYNFEVAENEITIELSKGVF